MSGTPFLMYRGLQGRRIALAEGRQLEELAEMLEKEGAQVLRYPLIRILDNPNTAEVQPWLESLIADRFQLLVLMTGEAIRRLVGFADRQGLREAFLVALGRIPSLSRGPKPNQVLKEFGLKATWMAQSPTSAGVIATLSTMPLQGQNVAVTRHGNPSPDLDDFLQQSGAHLFPVQPYLYAPAVDVGRVMELARAMAGGEIDVLVVTSSPQVDRLYEVVLQENGKELLDQAWKKTRVAAVGPVVAENLARRQAPVDICPEQGFVMKNLVQQIKKAFVAEKDLQN